MNGDGQRTDSKVQQRILTRHTRISRSAETAHADIKLYADRSCIRGSRYGQNANKIDTNATSKVANGTGHAEIPQVLTWLTRRRRQSLFSRDGATLSRVRGGGAGEIASMTLAVHDREAIATWTKAALQATEARARPRVRVSVGRRRYCRACGELGGSRLNVSLAKCWCSGGFRSASSAIQ
jgi:hypothetical protein